MFFQKLSQNRTEKDAPKDRRIIRRGTAPDRICSDKPCGVSKYNVSKYNVSKYNVSKYNVSKYNVSKYKKAFRAGNAFRC